MGGLKGQVYSFDFRGHRVLTNLDDHHRWKHYKYGPDIITIIIFWHASTKLYAV